MGAILSDHTAKGPEIVVVGVPTFGRISMYWHLQTHDMLVLGKPMGRAVAERIVKGHRVDEARNLIVSSALEMEGQLGARVSHIFFLDDDVLVSRDTLIQLLSHNRPIVSGLYYAKSHTPQPLLFKAPYQGPATEWPAGELVECYAHGMGCTLITREVFEAVEPPWFKTEEGRLEGHEFISHTEDVYFLERAAQAGFSPCVDTSCLAIHYDHKTDVGYPLKAWEAFRVGAPFSVEALAS